MVAADTNLDTLVAMKTAVESWEKYHQVEFLRILVRGHKSKINQNKYGIFVNLSCLGRDVVAELQNYVDYVNAQMSTLRAREREKEEYRQQLST